jgi:hypothetical protein
MKTLLFLLLCLLPAIALGQNVKGYAASLRGSDTVHVFNDEKLDLVVTVWSKWIERSGGTAQFRIEAEPLSSPPNRSISVLDKGAYIQRLRNCVLGLSLEGGDSFPIGTVFLSSTIGRIDENGHMVTLDGSGQYHLTASQYRDFVQHGGWSFTWTCQNR